MKEITIIRVLKDMPNFKKGDLTWVITDGYFNLDSNKLRLTIHPEENIFCKNYNRDGFKVEIPSLKYGDKVISFYTGQVWKVTSTPNYGNIILFNEKNNEKREVPLYIFINNYKLLNNQHKELPVDPINYPIGFKFLNSIGNITTIVDISLNGIILESELGTIWEVSLSRLRHRFSTGHYKLIKNKEKKQLKINIKDEKNKTITKKPRELSKGTSISSSSTRQIASASRLVGNPKTAKYSRTKVTHFKISKKSISI